MADLGDFDATTVEPATGGFQVLPAGKYRAVIVKSDRKPNKAGNGSYLELHFEVVHGEHKGARVISRLNLQNPNQQAVAIARAELSAICHATGVMKPKDSQALHNIPIVISVAVEKYKKDDGGEGASNQVKRYESTEAAGNIDAKPATTASSSNAAPWE